MDPKETHKKKNTPAQGYVIQSPVAAQTLTPPSYGKVGGSLKNQPDFQFGHVGVFTHRAPRKVSKAAELPGNALRLMDEIPRQKPPKGCMMVLKPW